MRRKQHSKTEPKNQHWVPQFYLRYFATLETRDTEAPKVWIFSKNHADGDEVLTNVRNVCSKRYLYSPSEKDGGRSWDVDGQITNLETLLGKLWPVLAEGYVNLGDETIRKALSLFIAVMHLRHPDNISMAEEIHGTFVDLFESGPLNADGTPEVDEFEFNGKTHQLDSSGWHEFKNADKDAHHRFFVSFVRTEAGSIAEHLMGKRWSIVFSESDTFITTDKPVVVSHQTRKRFGYGTPRAVIYFPLSPTRILILDDLHEEPHNQYYPLKDTAAGSFNFILWQGASRFLITGRKLEDVLTEICTLDKSTNNIPPTKNDTASL